MNALAHFVNIVPKADEVRYASLREDVRNQLDGIMGELQNLLRAKSLLAACRDVAPSLGMKANALYNRVRMYKQSRDWRELVNKAAAGPEFWESAEPIGLSPAFQQFYKGLCERHQRVNKGGYRELMLIWTTHFDSGDGTVPPKRYDAIPGYDTWPKAGKYGYPDGWSYRNLSRFSPDLYDSAATRQGAFTASLYRPPVLKTRVGLSILERIQMDDHEYNVKVHFPGQPKAMRPRGFSAADELSGFIMPSFKPTLWDMENEAKKALTEKDAMWFVIYMLCNVGYRVDERGTLAIVEKGTMAVKKPFAERIHRATGGKVIVSEPGMFNKPAHKGQFEPRGKGNFKHKPLVEAGFSLVDNYLDGLAGQVGLNRLTAPEEMHGRERYLQGLLKAAATLPQEKAEKMILPVLNWASFMGRAVDLHDALNRSADHEMEGWTELGYHDIQFRLALPDGSFTPWQSQSALLALPEPQRNAIQTLVSIDTQGQLTRAVNLSRHQVFHAELRKAEAAGLVTKLSPWRYAELMGLDNGYEVVVNKQSMFVVESRDFGIKPLHYLASINGKHLAVGDKYLAFINPWSPRVMLLCKCDGKAVGLCELWDMPAANDEEAQLRMVGKQAEWEGQRRQLLNARHAIEATNLQHMKDHNAALMAPDAPTEEEKALEQKLDRAAKREATDFSELSSGQEPAGDSEREQGATMDELNEL